MTPWNVRKALFDCCAIPRCGRNSGAGRPRRVLLGAVAWACLSAFSSAQDKTPAQAAEPLAVFAGKPIDESQLPARAQAQLQKMMEQVYAVRLRALHEVVDRELLEAEAKQKGVSVDDLIKAEVVSKVANATDEQVQAYYESHLNYKTQIFEEVKDKIRQEIKENETERARVQYVQALWLRAVNDGKLEVLMIPPKLDLPADPARLRGDPKAPVTIVEFSDFSCPFCRKAEPIMTELLAKYPGKVKLTYRDFPLGEAHPQAHLAAEASRCAGEQGKYWEYHDLLFANSAKQTEDALLEDARALKLDDQKFDTCLNSGRYKTQVDKDVELGSRVGVVSTPAFFINGKFVSGAQPASTFEKIIDEQLAASTQKDAGN
jgi:protein-disulfide isomerase